MGHAAPRRGGDERSRHGIPGPPRGGPRAPVSFAPNDPFWGPTRPRRIHWLHWAPRGPPPKVPGAQSPSPTRLPNLALWGPVRHGGLRSLQCV